MKKSSRLFCGIILAVCMASFSFFSCQKMDGKKKSDITIGVLSFLNFPEERFLAMRDGIIAVNRILEEQGYLSYNQIPPNFVKVRYYDTLDALVLALKTKEIQGIGGLPQTTAEYLCSKDSSLILTFNYDMTKKRRELTFVANAYERLGDGFAFMMLERNSALRDQLNSVIGEMQNDGSLTRLIREQIIAIRDGHEPTAIIPEKKPGRKTIKVAVTGSLPPMDYVASNGTFAGFNTAFLAEIGKRLDRNITMVHVSSLGRTTALANGSADVVFWTRSPAVDSSMLSEDYVAFIERMKSINSTEQEAYAMDILTQGMTGKHFGDPRIVDASKDRPDGAITTEPYFFDMPVTVTIKQ